MNIWFKFNHPNILRLIGFIIEGGYPSLISEWIEHGTMVDYLKSHPEAHVGKLVSLKLIMYKNDY